MGKVERVCLNLNNTIFRISSLHSRLLSERGEKRRLAGTGEQRTGRSFGASFAGSPLSGLKTVHAVNGLLSNSKSYLIVVCLFGLIFGREEVSKRNGLYYSKRERIDRKRAAAL